LKERKTMKITFLIGNGFDISCGMKSSYKDVCNVYKHTYSDNKVLQNFKDEISDWGDFEMELAAHAKDFNTEEELIMCLRDFKKCLVKHLEGEQKRFHERLASSQENFKGYLEECASSMVRFYQYNTNKVTRDIDEKIKMDPPEFRFISFNYTSTFDYLLMFVKNNNWIQEVSRFPVRIDENPIHVHGTIENDVTLGIDNELQLSNTKYKVTDDGKRAIIKPVFNSEFDPERTENALDSIRQSDIICTYGMTLGKSDLTWRNSIISWLNDSDEHIFFCYDYDYAQMDVVLTDEKMEIENRAIKDLMTKWDEDYEGTISCSIMKQIHIPIGNNIFRFKRN